MKEGKKCKRRKEEWKKERRVKKGKKSGRRKEEWKKERRKEERVKRENIEKRREKCCEEERWSVREGRVRGIEEDGENKK